MFARFYRTLNEKADQHSMCDGKAGKHRELDSGDNFGSTIKTFLMIPSLIFKIRRESFMTRLLGSFWLLRYGEKGFAWHDETFETRIAC